MTRIQTLRHSGSLRTLFPTPRSQGMSAVLINTAGGITGGDEFSIDASAGAGSRLTLTTQAAERAYRAQPGETGTVTVKLCVKPKAQIAWLPQETLLFEKSSLRRRLDAEVATDAGLLVVEPIVFGRIAMGEVLTEARFEDRWRVHRDGTLIFADMVKMDGAIQHQLEQSAIADHARAMATVLLVAPNAEAMLPRLQALLGDTCGASLIRPGVLLARLLAPDSFLLRRTLIPVIRLLNQNEIPKTWVL
ncbi:MAG: urease accessory protein UreD [Marinosulfonomonas sp.]|nr:urease accessory protein UreD [Marinosulfonomonas sp.]